MNTKTKTLAYALAVVWLVCLNVFLWHRTSIRVEAQTQPMYVPRVNGHGIGAVLTNTTLKGDTRIGTGAEATNLTLRGTSSKFGLDAFPDMDSSSEAGWLQMQADGKFQRTFDASSLTNFQFPATTIVHVSGKATFVQTNVTFKSIDFNTNAVVAGGSTIDVDLNKSYAAFATNANFTITGLIGKDAGGTNVQASNYFITNSAASAITCTMNANFQNMNANGNTLFITNVGHLLVMHYPGLGSNFWFLSR